MKALCPYVFLIHRVTLQGTAAITCAYTNPAALYSLDYCRESLL